MNEFLILILAGALGGLMWHIFYTKGSVVIPYLENGVVHLGVLFNIVLGAVYGFLTPYGLGALLQPVFPAFPVLNNPATAFFAGLGSIVITEQIIQLVFRKGGIPT